MRRSRDRKRTVVVDFSHGSIKMALAETAGEAVRFHGITRIPVMTGPPGEPDDAGGESAELETKRIVESLRPEVRRRGWQGLPAACLLSGSSTSTQSFLFPSMPPEDLKRAIGLKLSETLHFDLEEAYLDHRRLLERASDEQAPTLTLVAAARIDAVRQGVSVLRQAGLRPVAIGAAAESLANLSQCTSLWNSEEASIHVELGSNSSILNLFEGNQLRFSREINSGGGAFLAALMRPILTSHGPVQLTSDQAEQVLMAAGYPMEGDGTLLPHGIQASDILPLMEPVAQRISAEIERSIDYLSGLLDRPKIDQVVLSGSAGTMRNLDRFLQESLNTPVVCHDPVARAMSHWRLAVIGEHLPDLVDFSAILGYSLGNREPINLLPREEKIEQMVELVSRARKTVVPSVAAAGICLAFAGVPITRTYQKASDVFQSTSEQVDARLRQKIASEEERHRTNTVLQDVRSARGLVPDWIGIMKELSVILPEEAQITLLEAESSQGSTTLFLDARIHPGQAPFDAITTQMSVALSTSPYFEDVHVIEASIPNDGSHGRFEATMAIVAGSEPPR